MVCIISTKGLMEVRYPPSYDAPDFSRRVLEEPFIYDFQILSSGYYWKIDDKPVICIGMLVV